MNFDDWYDSLPTHVQRYVRTFAFHPTESNKGFVTGYLQAAQDYGVISIGVLAFWFRWSVGVMEGLERVEEYFR